MSLDAGRQWSEEVPVYCGVTRDQYPEPRPCPVPDPMPDVPGFDGVCHLGHPYNCRLYLTEVLHVDWRVKP